MNACPIHLPGDPLCHYPRPVERITIQPEAKGWIVQLLDLKWEVAFVLTLLGGIVYAARA